MVFSSYVFIFAFLPVTLVTYFMLSKKNLALQHVFLVSASLFFYAFFNLSYLLIIVASIVANYILAKAMVAFGKHSKTVLLIGILFNIGMLAYYKYYDFFVENINVAFGSDFVLKHILLPLGISFFTFQQFSFLISVYKGEEKIENFIDYSLFVSFFPQLVAGPIVLYGEMIPQFTAEENRFVNYDNVARGLYMFSIGLFKKVVIADSVALFANNGFEITDIGFSAAWLTAFSYSLQIYFDFSGYSDMAIGLGKMFNINIPRNFISPYKSESMTEFWRRWHITLGRALSTYVYIPLGGSRKGKVRTYRNLLVTFLVSGLWHGADWTFVLWGVLHGMCCVFERLFSNLLLKIPRAIKIPTTFLLVNFLWVLFRAPNFATAQSIYRGMFNVVNLDVSQISSLVFDGWINFPKIVDIVHIIVVLGILYFIVFRARNSLERFEVFSPTVNTMLSTVLLLCVSVIHLSRENVFIYFNF